IGNDGERLAAKRVDRLLDGREVVQNILRPRRDGESRLGSIEGGILRFGQPKKGSAQSRLVQPVRCRYIKAGSDYASVFGSRPASPLHSIPFGKIQRLVPMS